MSPKRTLKLLLKTGVTIFALWYVLHKIDLAALRQNLETADGWWLLAALVAFNASKIASAHRLLYYFEAVGLRLKRGYNLMLYYVGMFYNLFLPGGIGGDGYKVYLLAKKSRVGLKPLLGAVLLDRVSGLVALLFYACLLFAFSDYAGWLGDWSRWGAVAGVLALFPAAWWMTKRFFAPFLAVFTPTALWGLAVQGLQLLSAWSLLMAIDVSAWRLEYLTLFLVSSVVAVLPLTIGGVGVRELTFLYGLEAIGQPPESGVSFSFLFFIITALSSLVGLLWLGRVAAPKTQEVLS
ncbi:lysylphosphatidylglycerol synthase transmembrane domain-containing protein [Hydrogenimonas sp.]